MKDPVFKTRFVKNNVVVFAGHMSEAVMRFLLIPVVVKAVGTANYGAYVLLLLFISFCYALSGLGAGVLLRRYLPSALQTEEKNRLFYTLAATKGTTLVFMAAVAWLFRNGIQSLFFQEGPEFMMPLVILILILYSVYSLLSDYLRYTDQLGTLTLANIGYPAIVVMCVLASVYFFGFKTVNCLLGSEVLALGLVVLPMLYIVIAQIGLPRFVPDIRFIRSDVVLGLPLCAVYLTDFVMSGSDRYIISHFMSMSAAGCFSVAFSVASMVLIVPRIIGVATPQLLAQSHDRDLHDEKEEMVRRSIEMFLYVALPFAAVCSAMSGELLRLIGNKTVAESALYSLPLLAFSSLFCGMNMILNNVLFVHLKTLRMLQINAIGAILNLALNLTLLYFFQNITIAAGTKLLGYIASNVMMWHTVLRYQRIKLGRGVLPKVVFSSIAVYVVARLLVGANVNLAVVVLSTAAAYAILSLATGLVNAGQFRQLKAALF